MQDIQFSERLVSFLFFLPLFFLSLAVHEFSHAYFAYKKGDPTAKNLGRLTLNPLKHIDLVGSLLMPLMSFASGYALIGWAKPVPVDRRNFKNELMDDAIVSSAGPISNFLLAILFFLVFIFASKFAASFGGHEQIVNVLWYGVYLNIFLFAFNLLPIPPLDGSHILYDLFPNRITASILNLGMYGSLILIFFIYSPLWKYFSKFINLLLSLFLKIAGY